MGCGGSCGGTCGSCGGHGDGAACAAGHTGRASGCASCGDLAGYYSPPPPVAPTVMHAYAMGSSPFGWRAQDGYVRARAARGPVSGALRARAGTVAVVGQPDVPRGLARAVDPYGVPVARYGQAPAGPVANPRAIVWSESHITAMADRITGPCSSWRRASGGRRRALATQAALAELIILVRLARAQGDGGLAVDLEAASHRLVAGETPRLVERIVARVDAACDAQGVPRASGIVNPDFAVDTGGGGGGIGGPTDTGLGAEADLGVDTSDDSSRARITTQELELAGQVLHTTGDVIAAAIASNDRIQLARITASARVEIAQLQSEQASSENAAKVQSLQATIDAMNAAAAGQHVAIENATSSQLRTIGLAIGGVAVLGLGAALAIKLL